MASSGYKQDNTSCNFEAITRNEWNQVWCKWSKSPPPVLCTPGYLFESVGSPDPDAVVLIICQGGHRVVLQSDGAVPTAGDMGIFCILSLFFGFMIFFNVSMIKFVMLTSHLQSVWCQMGFPLHSSGWLTPYWMCSGCAPWWAPQQWSHRPCRRCRGSVHPRPRFSAGSR